MSSKSKSKSKEGLGFGDCDCEKGMVELRILYSGSDDVDIEFLDKSGDDNVCEGTSRVTQGTEVTCNVQTFLDGNGDPYFEKLETETTVVIRDASNGNEICTTEIHTSCSQDIVGTEGDGDCDSGIILVTGWRDGSDDDNNCDDGLDECDCETGEPEEPEEPQPQTTAEAGPVGIIVGDKCYCELSRFVI